MIVSVTPDWRDGFGHFGAWEHRLFEECRSVGRRYVSLTHRSLADGPSFALPSFSSMFHPMRTSAEVARFEAELRLALRRTIGDEEATVCMYAGSVQALAAMNVIATEMPGVRFVINLMRSHPVLERSARRTEQQDSYTRVVLASSRRSGVRVCVDSSQLRSDAIKRFNFSLEVWPMMITTDPTTLARNSSAGPVRIVAPTQPQLAKGYDLIAGLCRLLAPRIRSDELAFVARERHGSPTDIEALSRQIRESGGTLVHGDLSMSEYGALLAAADVVLVPYRCGTFRTRTSAVVLDAALAGAPPIATQGTWAAEVLSEYGIGAVFSDGDLDSLAASLDDVVEHLPAHRESVAASAGRVADDFSAHRVVAFLDHVAFPDVSEAYRRLARAVAYEAYQVLDTIAEDEAPGDTPISA